MMACCQSKSNHKEVRGYEAQHILTKNRSVTGRLCSKLSLYLSAFEQLDRANG